MVDLGSNSVRLVVFEGRGRNPVPIFNEKAVLRLGRGLQTTGRLNEAGVAQALKVMVRYHAIAARDARRSVRGAGHRRGARRQQRRRVRRHARSHRCPARRSASCRAREEARLSAAGVHCGIPGADGILADIGGGSLELVRLDADRRPRRRHAAASA